MFKNYLRIAIRNVQRHKGYAFINIAGLAIGMTCCILIIAYVVTELSYDKYHENADKIYRIGAEVNMGGFTGSLAVSNAPLGPVLKQDYPEVMNAARIRPISKTLVKYEDRQFYEEQILHADKTIFDIFSFPMIKGDPKTALVTAYSVVLTEETAQKYFGEEDPLGKVLKFNNQDDFTITGIVENVPKNSHFTFDMLCSFETFFVRNKGARENWFNFHLHTYLLLRENYDYTELEKKFPAVVDKYMGKIIKSLGGELKYFLQPLTSIHLHSKLEGEISGNSNILYIYIFASIALFILLIACINFMNLATARSATRAKEVGMRKVIGAHKRELIRQFLGESIIYSFFSLIVALILVQFALPLFRSISGTELRMNFAEMSWLIPGLLGFVLFVGIIAGSYPALFLSSFQPAMVLKGSLKSGAANKRFRSTLVVAQFVISVALIIGTGIVLNQLDYMKNTNLNFDKKNVIFVRITDQKLRQSLEFIKNELKNIPGVISLASSSNVPGQTTDVSPHIPEGFQEDNSQLMESIDIDHDFLPTLGIEIVDGRNFSTEFATDTKEAVIINETAAKKFGWDKPVGKTIKSPGSGFPMLWRTKTVIGVVRDFHFSSLHKIIMPLLIGNGTNYLDTISIKIGHENTRETLSALQEKWKEIDPFRPFEYSFLDETFDSQYRSDERLSKIFASFTVFAIFIACLGLFGLASFMAEQRTKEIGIRKVLGASVPGIVTLLSKNFLKLVIIANIIAWPISYFVMKNWLQNFAYRTNMGLGVFVLTGVLSLCIALLTVSYQSIKASVANPVDSIKYE
ncbi:MAG: ABC transporter permease [Candidatus Aminicenantes bacterium]|nr:MAG: ABC transporter permease [Candidatus Aminicenantes bacterium]